jgi:hypothetical protein
LKKPRTPVSSSSQTTEQVHLLFVEGLTETPEDIKARIHRWLDISDAQKLRKYYRLLITVIEE